MDFIGNKDFKKIEKAEEGRKDHIKGQRVNESKNLQFFCIFGFFSSRLLPVFYIFQFRGHWGQKGRSSS